MNTINILILISTVLFLLVLWAIVGVRHLKYLKNGVKEQWELIDERLRKRHDLIPNLIETVRVYIQDQEVLLEKLIIDRTNAAREYSPNLKKIENEHELILMVKQVVDLGVGCAGLPTGQAGLAKDTNFLELIKEIEDIGKDVELKVGKYNEMVRYYNRHRNMILLMPVAVVFKFGVMNIFEVEA